MKPPLFIILSLCFTLQSFGQLYKTVDVPAGGLHMALTAAEKSSITHLTVTGTIDARDFRIMRDSIPLLSALDITGAAISAYSGEEGTRPGYYEYPSNKIPILAFCSMVPNIYGGYYFYGKASLQSVAFPATLTSIGDAAFYRCSGLNDVTLPPSVREIDNGAFEECTGLLSITVPSGVTILSEKVFAGCTSLTTADIQAGITAVPNNLFDGCTSLRSVIFPPTIGSVGIMAFNGCSSLATFPLSEGVVTIGYQSFAGCSALTELRLPSSVTTIDQMAFNICTGLKSLVIPSTVTSVGERAFAICYSLEDIDVSWSEPLDLSGSPQVFYTLDPSGCTLHVPSGTLSLYAAADQWGDFTHVEEKPGLSASPSRLFLGGGTGTAEVTISASMPWTATSEDSWLSLNPSSGMAGTTTLTLALPENTTGSTRTTQIILSSPGFENLLLPVSQYAMVDVTPGTLRDQLAPSGMLELMTHLAVKGTIDARDFKTMRDEMPLLISVDLREATIAAYTGTEGTGSYTNPPPVIFYEANTIPQYGFSNRINLTTLLFPPSLTAFGEYCFYYTGFTHMDIPSSVTSLGRGTFANSQLLEYVTIPESITRLENDAFAGCSSLSGIVIPSTVTAIGDYAFNGCTALTSLEMPASVTSVGTFAFQNCWELTSLTVPSQITELRNGTFAGCRNLTAVQLPPGLKVIGEGAFSGCTRLATLVIPSTVGIIKANAFEGCQGLTSLHIPEMVKAFRREMFMGCSGLTSISISASVTTIESRVFAGCTGLQSIIAGAVEPVYLMASEGVFDQVDKSACILHVPFGCSASYKAAVQWKEFTLITEEPGIFVSPSIVQVSASGGSQATVTVASSAEWQVISGQEWLTVTPLSGGPGQTVITITVAQNSGSTLRRGVLTFSASGLEDHTVTIEQSPMITVSAGTLNDLLTQSTSLNTTHALTLSGTIDARDFRTMRDAMPELEFIDLSNTVIMAYEGTEGTDMSGTSQSNWAIYPAHSIPAFAFCTKVTIDNISQYFGKNTLKKFLPPAGITAVGYASFFNCKGLSDYFITSLVDSVGVSAFAGCSASLTVANDHPRYSSGNGMLFNKEKTLLIQCPVSLTGSPVIPASVETIGTQAFFSCSGMTALEIPPTVSSIMDAAFVYCSGLTSIMIPETVTLLGNTVFQECQGLANAEIHTRTVSFQAFWGCSALTTLILGPNIKSIERSAFAKCQNLINLTIPSSVTSIGETAFMECNALTHVTIPASVAVLGRYAFYNCAGLQTADVYSRVIDNSAFSRCAQLNTVTLYSPWLSLDDYVFLNCGSLVSLKVHAVIPADLTPFENVFRGVSPLGCTLYVPTGSGPAYRAAERWKDFLNIVEMAGLFVSQYKLCAGEAADTLELSVTSSGNWQVTSDQPWVTFVSLKRSSGIIPLQLFVEPFSGPGSRTAFITVTADGLEPQIVRLTQYGKLEVTPGGLDDLIAGMDPPEYLTIKGTIDARDFKTLRDEIPEVTVIDLSEAVIVAYTGTEGPAGNSMVNYPADAIPESAFYDLSMFRGLSFLHTFRFPPSVKTIEKVAFMQCHEIADVVFPGELTSIGEQAFYWCNKLTKMIIPGNVTVIGASSFEHCTNLVSAEIRSGAVGVNAFKDCENITTLSLYPAVTAIGTSAFQCRGLLSIFAYPGVPIDLTPSPNVFFEVDKSLCVLHVPYGSLAAYQNADQWKDFFHMEEFSPPETPMPIPLTRGWNIFSSPLLLTESDLEVLFQPLITGGLLEKVQDEAGNVLEDTGFSAGWTNTIGDWTLTEGYKVKVTGNCILPINGTPAVLPPKIPLKTGWNIVSFPKQSPAEAMEVVQQLIDRHSLVKVQDEKGNAIEDFGSFGGWQNNIGAFIPGKGYRMKVNTSDTLTIENADVKSGIVPSR